MMTGSGAVAQDEFDLQPRERTVERVLLAGDGVASRCCAHLLAARGLTARIDPRPRAGAPALLLSDQAASLIGDVLGRPGMFEDGHRIERRIVAWGGPPVTLPHRSVALSEAQVLAAFPPAPAPEPGFAPDLTLEVAPSDHTRSALMRFGERRAAVARVRLAQDADAQACWIEALDAGWLFLIPTSVDGGWVMAVGGLLTPMLEASTLIAPVLRSVEPQSAMLDAAPRMTFPLQAEGWLACGGAAMAFDPICGDGTANAVRQAILASAVISAADGGGLALRSHYESMLVAAMRRHLRLCMDFYQRETPSPWWDAQLTALTEGYAWCTAHLARAPEPAFELHGFDLAPRVQ